MSVGPDRVRERVAQLAGGLSENQLVLLERMATALTVPVTIERYDSDLVDDDFSEALSNFLLLHHAIHEEPLNKAAFEYVLKGCAEVGGKTARLNEHRGSATWDVQVDDSRWSLKTEAAKGMSRTTLKIEKLMEARWIRECTNPAKCAAAVQVEVPKHMSGYDRILALRAFRQDDGAVRYDLVEPPMSVLRNSLGKIPSSAFTKEGSKESYGANAETESGERIFRILLDSSVEKIRLWFNIKRCIRHGSWTVLPSQVQDAAGSSD